MKKLIGKNILSHPIVFGIYPILALYFNNRNEIPFSAIQKALITSIVLGTIVITSFLLIFRSWRKAALPSSLTLLLFYSYGHVNDILNNVNLFGEPVGRHRYMIPFWILAFIIGQALLVRLKNANMLNKILNTVSTILMFFLCVQALIFAVQSATAKIDSSERNTVQQESLLPEPSERDIYYILIDAYSRQDILLEDFYLDTSEFISELENLGFYIPDCTQSNYDNTLTAMASTLNMNYLDTMGISYRSNKKKIHSYIQKNLVLQEFKNMGYSTATFASLYPFLHLEDVTYYYDYFDSVSTFESQATLNFQYLFLETTLIQPIIEFMESKENLVIPEYLGKWLPTRNALENRDYRQYLQNVYALSSLEKIPNIPEKKFVYAHLYITHQPFVFYPDGRFHPFLIQDNKAYRDQVIFLNQRLIGIIKTILAKSDPQPIVVIQSDHSYLPREDRVKILNAYYFPDGGDQNLYETITPVNTFRLVFNTYFDGNYPLLQDISHYIDAKGFQQEAPSTCVNINP